MTSMNPEQLSRAQINLETAQIGWCELQRYFASDISPTLDLVEVA